MGKLFKKYSKFHYKMTKIMAIIVLGGGLIFLIFAGITHFSTPYYNPYVDDGMRYEKI